MNDFSKLDQQNAESRSAFIASNELPEESAPVFSRGINAEKLLLHNLCAPFHKRISRKDLERKLALAPLRSRLLALQAKIQEEIAPKLAALRERDSLMSSI